MARNKSGMQINRIIDHQIDDAYIDGVLGRLTRSYSLRVRGGGETR